MIHLEFEYPQSGLTCIVGSTEKLHEEQSPHPALAPQELCFSYIKSYSFKLELVDQNGFSIRPERSWGYFPPVNIILELGSTGDLPDNFTYQSLGIKSEHIPELIHLLCNESIHEENYEPLYDWIIVHASRALLELKATQSIPAFLGMLRLIDDDNNDLIADEFPDIIGEFGEAALEPTARYLADPSKGDWSRMCSVSIISKIAELHPHLKEPCREILHHQLEKMEVQSYSFNSSLMCSLVDLKSFASLDLIEKGFKEGRFNKDYRGDWESVQIDMGLLEKRITPYEPGPFFKKMQETLEPLRKQLLKTQSLDSFSNLMDQEAIDYGESIPNFSPPFTRLDPKVGRNDPCPCGSEKKYKKCCLK